MSVSQYINGDVILMFKSSQVKYIYIALFTIQIVSKLLHSINHNSVCLFMKKRQSSLVELINGMINGSV